MLYADALLFPIHLIAVTFQRVENRLGCSVTRTMKKDRLFEFERFFDHRGDVAFGKIEFAAPTGTVVVIAPERRAAFKGRSVQHPFDSADRHFRLRRAQLWKQSDFR